MEQVSFSSKQKAYAKSLKFRTQQKRIPWAVQIMQAN